MTRDQLGTKIRFHAIVGAGYPARLYEAYVKLIAGTPNRPLVVLSLWVRGLCAAWAEHPLYGYRNAQAVLDGLGPSSPTWRMRATITGPNQMEMDLHDQVRHPTLAGDLRVGDYRTRLRDPIASRLAPEDHVRLLYSFHHGAAIQADSRYLQDVTSLGRSLRRLGCDVVAYEAPVPVQRGAELLGERFVERVARNLCLMNRAFLEGYGPLPIIQSGQSFADSDFIDPNDATEHLNERGRWRLAGDIAQAIETLRSAY